ncbi:MAG: DUF4936 family protein [Rubrivivax sp.]|nr:DUF4936 family protein [Rubrivivax sp.]
MSGAELFIYWHCAAARESDAVAAFSACQAALQVQHPGLRARLLRRTEDRTGRVTLMEIYVRPGGLDEATRASLLAATAAALAGLADGPRHVEVFRPVGDDGPDD